MLASQAVAGPAHGCSNAFAADVVQAEPVRLRAMAADCDQPTTAELLYNRAYHAELLEDLALLARLQRGRPNSDRLHWEQGRIYIALAEAFAARAARAGTESATGELNRAYDGAIRLAERAINGYGRMAGAGGGR
jgi:hypothetical protein